MEMGVGVSAVIAGKSTLLLKQEGTDFAAILILAVIMFLYAWGYFALLRRVADSLMWWILVFFGGAVFPLFLAFS
ncbi:MAG: hypothetical protein Q3966_08840 [Neisseria sp.]|nr:hypothetical protein [Neisseria sp.]